MNGHQICGGALIANLAGVGPVDSRVRRWPFDPRP
jgi:hypothetical protein